MVCVRTLVLLALLHDATFLYVEAEAAVAHAPMNSVSDVGVATTYLLIQSTAHMQASESLTATSLKANPRVLRLGCNCTSSILILIEPDAVDLFQGPDSGLGLLGFAWLWQAHAHTRAHTHVCRSRVCGLCERASAVECEVIIHGSYFGPTMLLANRRFPQGRTLDWRDAPLTERQWPGEKQQTAVAKN